jgi:hypothetical protein
MTNPTAEQLIAQLQAATSDNAVQLCERAAKWIIDNAARIAELSDACRQKQECLDSLKSTADEMRTINDRVHLAKIAELERDQAAFKNFHRALCERFRYEHDETDWRRDQMSLIEWIAKRAATEPNSNKADSTSAGVDQLAPVASGSLPNILADSIADKTQYTITIENTTIDGERMWSATVRELPHVAVYEDSRYEALHGVFEVIENLDFERRPISTDKGAATPTCEHMYGCVAGAAIGEAVCIKCGAQEPPEDGEEVWTDSDKGAAQS